MMVKATLSTTIDYDIAEQIEKEAIERNISVSQLIREILTERYENRKIINNSSI